MPSKPLRFLYTKYAGQAPVPSNNCADEAGGINTFVSLLSKTDQSADNTITQGQLQRLGREFTKLERINMFFAMSQNNSDGISQAFSSVGSASTNSRSCHSRRGRILHSSPTRFRSKSQEFQSKYKLAASRSSPEHRLVSLPQNEVNVVEDKSPGYLPQITVKKPLDCSGSHKENEKVMEITLQTRNSLRKSVLPAKGLASHYNLPSPKNYNPPNPNNPQRPTSSKDSDSFCTVEIRVRDDEPNQNTQKNRLKVDKLPRCLTGSPIDDDRLDSQHYQYLLDDFSSFSSSCSSVKSDPASTHFTARAHRPSTAGTNSTNRRMKDILTSSMDGATLPGTSLKTRSRHNSVVNKSPENQWPPRYAIIPSWPSYEDIHTLNSCGDHRNILTQLYRKESRWSRERNNNKLMYRNGLTLRYPYQQQQVHVVPSHTTTECAMCNLYSHRADPTACPPNSPLVNCRDHQERHNEQHSRLSNGYSVKANFGTPTNGSAVTVNAAPSSVMSKKRTSASPLSREQSKVFPIRRDSRQLSLGDSNTSEPSRCATAWQPINKTDPSTNRSISKSVTFSGKSKPEMSFTWDTCKLTYIKANM